MKIVSIIVSGLLFLLAGVADIVITIWDLKAFFDLADVSIVNLAFRIFLLTVIVCALFFGGLGTDYLFTKGEIFYDLRMFIFQSWGWGMVAVAPFGTHILFGAIKLIFEVLSFLGKIFH